MENMDRYRFVKLLALELENGDIALPSLPDVVLKVRSMLQRDNCDFEQISKAVSLDPVLVSRLFVFANSAFHNRANVKIETLDAAIGRLGFEVVRNTAVSIAIKQLYVSEKHSHANKYLRVVWARGMKLSSMSFAVAGCHSSLNDETAFMCGLLHDVGKLYIITKAQEFPEFLGDRKSFDSVMDEWNPQITKSIIEAWGFPQEVAESADSATYLDSDSDLPPEFVDIVHVAKLLLDSNDSESLNLSGTPSCVKLGIDENTVANILLGYREKLNAMQQSLS